MSYGTFLLSRAFEAYYGPLRVAGHGKGLYSRKIEGFDPHPTIPGDVVHSGYRTDETGSDSKQDVIERIKHPEKEVEGRAMGGNPTQGPVETGVRDELYGHDVTELPDSGSSI